jgi:hypothetical protein
MAGMSDGGNSCCGKAANNTNLIILVDPLLKTGGRNALVKSLGGVCAPGAIKALTTVPVSLFPPALDRVTPMQ